MKQGLLVVLNMLFITSPLVNKKNCVSGNQTQFYTADEIKNFCPTAVISQSENQVTVDTVGYRNS